MMIDHFRRMLDKAEQAIEEQDKKCKDGEDCDCDKHLALYAAVEKAEKELQIMEKSAYESLRNGAKGRG